MSFLPIDTQWVVIFSEKYGNFFDRGAIIFVPTPTKNTQLTMTRQHFLTTTLALLLVLSLALLGRTLQEQCRLKENYTALAADNRTLHTTLSERDCSVARLRMTIGELEELRREDAARLRSMGLKLRNVESLTLLETVQRLDTTILTSEGLSPPLLSDSLCRLRWQDSWVSLAADVRPTESHITLTSADTLFQVVRRVPWRWWIFSWGTKAIRQEIRSSNPHTRLVYAEYIELE